MTVSDVPNVTISQFECCGTTNFTDWHVTDLSQLNDDDGVASNDSSSSGGGHGNGSWSLSVPDSCCVELLEQVGCGWSVMNEVESRLNNIHSEARLLCLTCSFFFTARCYKSVVYAKRRNSDDLSCASYDELFTIKH